LGLSQLPFLATSEFINTHATILLLPLKESDLKNS
jgi:hypothetical protein